MTTAADIRLWLQRSTFLKADLLNGDAFTRLVEERMRSQGLSDAGDYLRLLQGSAVELERMVEGVAVQESWLFRYPAAFEVLADHLRQLRMRRAAGGLVRMISVGCADGQEPVSMAITALHAGWPADRVIIDALDFNACAIERARKGLYARRDLRPDRPAWADDWLAVRGDQVHTHPAVLQMIRYQHADALTATALSGARDADALFCRNVLIYLHDQARSVLLERFAATLVLGGLLFLGHAQGSCAHDLFQSLGVPHAFAWQRTIAKQRKPAPPQQTGGAPSRAARPQLAAASVPRAVGRGGGERMGTPISTKRQRAPDSSAPGDPRDSADGALARVRLLANQGDLQAARESAEALLAAQGPNPDVLELLGSIHLALGTVDVAQRCFRKAVYLDPQREAARLQLELLQSTPTNRGSGARSAGRPGAGEPPS